MKQEVHGNLTGIRDSVIDALAQLYLYEVEDGDFLPRELMQFLARFSNALNREIAIYITRDGEVVDVSVGTDRDVELRDYRLRRNAQRLSCVRCVHTHPIPMATAACPTWTCLPCAPSAMTPWCPSAASRASPPPCRPRS